MFISVLFVLLWMLVGFVVVRFLLGGYFREKHRATVVSGAVVVAFTLGASWPYTLRLPVPGVQSNTAQIAVATQQPAPLALATADVTGKCRNLNALSGAKSAIGYLDSVSAADGHSVASGGTLNASEAYWVSGWAGDTPSGPPSTAVCLAVDGHGVVDKSYVGGSRPDVAAATRSPTMLSSGFRIEIMPGSLPRGHHVLSVVAISSEGKVQALNGRWDINIP